MDVPSWEINEPIFFLSTTHNIFLLSFRIPTIEAELRIWVTKLDRHKSAEKGLSPVRPQAIIWTHGGSVLTEQI